MLESVFSPDDLAFLAEQNRRLPHLIAAFLDMAATPKEDRIAHANELLKTTPRRGPLVRGLPEEEIESVFGHSADTKTLAVAFNCRSHPPLDDDELAHAMIMIDVHDMPECLTTDIIPRDGIPKADKARLEDMAARLIFEDDPFRLAVFREYNLHETRVARWVGDLDKLQLMYWVRAKEEARPEYRAKLSDFWTDALNTVKTGLAKSEMARLVASRQVLVPA